MNTTRITHEGSPERFDPSADGGKLVHSEHLARYRWAAQLAAGKDVLDAGCGTGYGTRMLLEAGATRVFGVDADEEAVERTRDETAGRAELAVADVRALPLDGASVDLVACFEVIEHIDRRDAALREFARVLRPGGTLIISSPNRDQYLSGNEFHVHEYTPDEFERELRGVFANVRLHAQNAWLGSLLAGSGPPVVELGDNAGGDREGTFVVALASEGELPEMQSRVSLADPFEVRWWADRINDARAEVVAARGEALRSRGELERHEARVRELSDRLIALEQTHAVSLSEIEDLRGEIGELVYQLEQANWRHERADGVVASMQRSLSWRITKPLRGFKRIARR